jgi:hypothetical protein
MLARAEAERPPDAEARAEGETEPAGEELLPALAVAAPEVLANPEA